MVFKFRRNKDSVSSSTGKDDKDPQTTIARLRESIANADKRENYVQHKMAAIVQEAKLRSAQGDKRGALNALKRKKLYQAEVEKLQNVKMTLETQAIHIESAAYNQETVKVMKSGQTVMGRLRKMMGIDEVDNLMEDIREEADLATEVNNALGSPLDPLMEEDADLLAELEALGMEDSKKKQTQSSSFFMMPPVPKPQQNKVTSSRTNKKSQLVRAT